MESFEEYPHFFEVQLALFQGPIDLLLHLVKQNELPIEKLSLAEITNQYLECLEQLRQFDLEVAGEYLVIAATLLSIKSSILLQEPVELVEDEEGNLVDPHDELLRRIREAEIYKDGAQALGSRHLYGVDVFSPPPSLGATKALPVEFQDHDPMLLGAAFQKILNNLSENQPKYEITLDSVSIVERMMGVLEQLKGALSSDGRTAIVFYKLIPDITSRSSVIGTFVALLELCKRQVIRVQQVEESEEILVVLASDVEDGVELTSEFDEGEQVQVMNGDSQRAKRQGEERKGVV